MFRYLRRAIHGELGPVAFNTRRRAKVSRSCSPAKPFCKASLSDVLVGISHVTFQMGFSRLPHEMPHASSFLGPSVSPIVRKELAAASAEKSNLKQKPHFGMQKSPPLA